jgi:2,4-diaminopentanoate dehydrogenase
MGERRTKVVVWSTGWVGKLAIRAIARRPDLQLTGVWVHSAEKVGVDAGTLAGIEPLGVIATDDADALLASQPDCVCYAASGPDRDVAAIADYVRMLDAGINVVTVTSAGLVHPKAYEPSALAKLEDAAKRGGASIYASGIEPGFAGDQLVLTLLTMSSEVRSVRTQELFSYADYPVTFMMFDVFGFGMPLEHTPLMSMHGAQLGTWGPPVRMVADSLGVELDEIRETYEREVTPRRLEVAAGVIEAGTVGAIRMETIGVVDGRDAIVIEHVNRMAPDIAPHWPTGARDGTYRIVIEGTPSMQCELTVGEEHTASDEGMVATTMRIVNAIPYVCAAPPGAVSSLDLPLTLPRHAL